MANRRWYSRKLRLELEGWSSVPPSCNYSFFITRIYSFERVVNFEEARDFQGYLISFQNSASIANFPTSSKSKVSIVENGIKTLAETSNRQLDGLFLKSAEHNLECETSSFLSRELRTNLTHNLTDVVVWSSLLLSNNYYRPEIG